MAYLQMSPVEGAPEEFDQTIFPVRKDRTIGPAEELALKLVNEQQRYSRLGMIYSCDMLNIYYFHAQK